MPKIMLNSVEYTGGGGDSGMELTYDEYLALPEEEKTNGTTYYVKDINGAGKDQFQPVIYSEEEREIGVWTDGKPLYEKTLVITSPAPSGATGTIDISSLSVEVCLIADGYFQLNDGLSQIAINEDGRSWCHYYNDHIHYEVQYTTTKMVVRIRYTKTTDKPGSGTWTPQGVPAVHYDGDEKIVGTWFGETLYEKTFYIESMYISTSDWINTSITIPNCNGLIDQKAWCHDSDYRYIGGAYFYFSVLNGNLYLYAPRLYPSTVYDVYITLQYTKTT